MKTKGHWPRGKRRNDCPEDVAPFVQLVRRQVAARQIGRLLGVSDRTVRRWASGRCRPPLDKIVELVDLLWPQSQGALPIYSTDMAIDGGTRVGGVGDYTLRAARGETIHEVCEDELCQSDT